MSVATGAAALTSSPINVAALREQAAEELGLVLDSVRGRKALVIDSLVSGPLGLIAGVSMLKEHGVEKIYPLNEALETESQNIIYLVRPLMQNMLWIAGHINSHTRRGQRKEYAVYFCPRRTMICERVLEEKGVYDDVSIGEFHMDLVPFDDDVLSLELQSSYLECQLHKDYTSLFYVARSLMKMQAMFGVIPHIRGMGESARQVCDMMLRMRRETASEDKGLLSEIDTLILVDRHLDMVTPQLTQLTYEGLIDEMFGIRNSYADFEPEIVMVDEDKKKIPQMKGRMIKTALNSNDSLYVELRDLNLVSGAVGRVLNSKAREVEQYYNQRQNLDSLSEIRGFMNNLGNFQQLKRGTLVHTNIVSRIAQWTRNAGFNEQLDAEQSILQGGEGTDEFIDKLINMEKPVERVLRLLVLRTLCDGGLKQKRFEQLRHDIIQQYGLQYLPALQNLERMRLLYAQDKTSFFSSKPSASLMSEGDPLEIAYLYSGYVPLSVRIMHALQETTRFAPHDRARIEEATRAFPGPTVAVNQHLGNKRGKEAGEDTGKGKRVTLVFFLGGVTFAEISAVRSLASRDEHREYVIATTAMVNGDTLLGSLCKRL